MAESLLSTTLEDLRGLGLIVAGGGGEREDSLLGRDGRGETGIGGGVSLLSAESKLESDPERLALIAEAKADMALVGTYFFVIGSSGDCTSFEET